MTDRKEFDPAEYWEKRLAARYGLAGVGYAGVSDSYNRWLYRVRRRVFARVLGGLDIDLGSARVLDVGSGTGFYLDRWKAAGATELEGMDISTTAVTNLHARFPDVVVHESDIGAPEGAPMPEGSYDAVSAMDVMFHVVDDTAYERAIRNVHSMLAEGGLFIFSDNFVHGAERRLRHIVHRSLDDIRAVLRAVGFEVIERRPMFVLMNSPVDSSSRLTRGFWSLISAAARRGEVAGWIAGMLLYPVEVALTGLLEESPTTEVMTCRKPVRAEHGP